MNERPLTQGEFAVKITNLPKSWKRIAGKIKARDGRQCKKCRLLKRYEDLVVHHEDENQSNNDPLNLKTMCWPCHNSVPTTPISELYEKYLTAYYPEGKNVALGSSQPQPTGGEKDANELPETLRATFGAGRPSGITEEAEERRQLRCRDFKLDEDWEKWWWKGNNKLCNKCSNDCKQSSLAKILRCPDFKTME